MENDFIFPFANFDFDCLTTCNDIHNHADTLANIIESTTANAYLDLDLRNLSALENTDDEFLFL